MFARRFLSAASSGKKCSRAFGFTNFINKKKNSQTQEVEVLYKDGIALLHLPIPPTFSI